MPTPAEIAPILEDCFNRRDGARLMTLWADDFAYEGPGGVAFTGKAKMLRQEENLWTAFPDIRCSIEPFCCSADRVVFTTRMRGTHDGPLRLGDGASIPATGRTAEFTLSVHMRFQGGLIAGERVFHDTASLLRQLGLVAR
jgi:steroid delta-isomerase-like uncharacterized protein